MTTAIPSTSRVRWRPILAAVAVVVLAATGTAYALLHGRPPIDTSSWCDSTGGIRRADTRTDECVGVTDDPDSTYAFYPEIPELKNIQERIRKDNHAVTEAATNDAAQYYVDIAIVLPMPWKDNGLTGLPTVLHQLEGAYVRQHAVNMDRSRGHPPRVRLLVANAGYDAHAWTLLAERIKALHDDGHLVAVTGLGPSLASTASLLSELSKSGIATLGTIFTADNLHGMIDAEGRTPIRRITPTNTEEVHAALDLMSGIATPNTRAVLVAASNGKNDHFTQTLTDAFQQQYPDPASLEFFDPDSPASSQTLDGIAARICTQKDASLVYFAGRDDPALHLAAELGKHCSQDHPVIMVTGDSVTKSLGTRSDTDQDWPALSAALQSKKIQLYYTGLAHPDQWRRSGGTTSADEMNALINGLRDIPDVGEIRLDDGQAIMAYDSMLLLTKAVGQVATGIPLQDGERTAKLQKLDNGFLNITPKSPVCGASGPIVLVRGDNEAPGLVGNTVDKVIPIAQVVVNETGNGLRSEFYKLYYPNGELAWAGTCGRPSPVNPR